VRARAGRFEQAHGGTLFLDEIGEMPLETQAKLLRVLPERVVEPVGGERPVPVDFRLIAATNRDLKAMVDAGGFRLDLFYRLSTVMLEVPKLQDRREDIPFLCRHFLAELSELHGRPALQLERDALESLAAQRWPGNVRELRQVLERAVIFADGETLTRADFAETLPLSAPQPVAATRLGDATARLEEDMIRDAMQRAGGNKKAAAGLLGISRSHLYRRLEAMQG